MTPLSRLSLATSAIYYIFSTGLGGFSFLIVLYFGSCFRARRLDNRSAINLGFVLAFISNAPSTINWLVWVSILSSLQLFGPWFAQNVWRSLRPTWSLSRGRSRSCLPMPFQIVHIFEHPNQADHCAYHAEGWCYVGPELEHIRRKPVLVLACDRDICVEVLLNDLWIGAVYDHVHRFWRIYS